MGFDLEGSAKYQILFFYYELYCKAFLKKFH